MSLIERHLYKWRQPQWRQPQWRQPLTILRLVLFAILLVSAIIYGTITTAVALRTLRQQGSGLAAHQVPNGPAIPLLGITTQLEQYNPADRQSTLDRLHTAGFGWIRQRIDWAEIEPIQGQFNWQRSDAIINDISSHGLVPIILLDGSPAWARAQTDSSNPLAPPADPQTFANFTQAFATRYANKIRFYQLWDEPNIAPHWGSRWIEPIEYARLLRAGGCAIRNTDPDAVIINAALAPTTDRGHAAVYETLYLQRLIAATPPVAPLCPSIGPTPLFDIVAIQPYGFGHHPADNRQQRDILNFQRAATIRRTLVAAGHADTPIWATRFGWNRTQNSPWASVPAARQPEFAAAAIQHARTNWPWLQALGWHIDQPNAPTTDPTWGFSLTENLAHQIGSAAQTSSATTVAPSIRTFDLWKASLLILGLLATIAWRLPKTISQIPALFPATHKLASQLLDQPIIRALLWIALLYSYHAATWPPLILILCILAATLLFHTPRDGLLIAAVLLPFHFRHKEIWLFADPWLFAPAQTMLLCLIPALGHTIYRRISEAKFLKKAQPLTTIKNSITPIDLLACTWLLITLISFTNVWHKPAYLRDLVDMTLAPLLLYLATRLLIRTTRQWRHLLFALTLGGLLVALIGWTNWIGGSGPNADGIRRLVGPHYSPNHTALYLERTLFIALGLWIYHLTIHRPTVHRPVRAGFLAPSSTRSAWEPIFGALRQVRRGAPCSAFHAGAWNELLNLTTSRVKMGLFLIPILIIGLAILFTASRGALLLGLPAGALLFYLLSPKNQTITSRVHQITTRLSKPATLAISLSLILPLLILLTTYWDRLSNSATLWRRIQIWQATTQLWRDHLWTGVGSGGFYWRYPAYILDQPLLDPNIIHPHNIWLEYGAIWGVLGFAWLIAMIAVIALSWNKITVGAGLAPDRLALITGIYAALLAGIAHGQVDSFTMLVDIAAWNWLALGLVIQFIKINSLYRKRIRAEHW